MKNYKELVEYPVKRIVDEIKPLRILMFGSAARGNSDNSATLIFLL